MQDKLSRLALSGKRKIRRKKQLYGLLIYCFHADVYILYEYSS